MKKVLAEAERAWQEGKRFYLVQLTQMPVPVDEEEEEPEPEPWKDESLDVLEWSRLYLARPEPDRVVSTRMPDVEDAIDAICAIGWQVRDLRIGDTTLPMLGSSMTLLHADVAFVRPDVT